MTPTNPRPFAETALCASWWLLGVSTALFAGYDAFCAILEAWRLWLEAGATVLLGAAGMAAIDKLREGSE